MLQLEHFYILIKIKVEKLTFGEQLNIQTQNLNLNEITTLTDLDLGLQDVIIFTSTNFLSKPNYINTSLCNNEMTKLKRARQRVQKERSVNVKKMEREKVKEAEREREGKRGMGFFSTCEGSAWT